MMQEDSFSDEYDFDDEYEPIVLAENDQENDKFIGEKIFGNLPLSPQVKDYFANYKKKDKKKFMDLFGFKDQVEEHKSVCAKSIQRGETIAQCYDCASDNTCIQCMDCFKNSNHQGHKVIIKKAYGGCCDCGDMEAWKKEGFCSKHTGQTIDIQIDPKEQETFLTEMKQLFFLLFRQSIQQNTNFTRDYSNKLLKNLCYINQKGVYYNKLTYLLFSSKLTQQQVVSKNVKSRTILGNILSPKVAKNLQIDDWMQLFFSMFQYYPFKKLLLSTYMRNFSIIYGQEEAISRGSSISCQLLTSHQLVRDYVLQQDSVPMGADIKMDRVNSFQTIFFMLYHDLNYITKLQADTPQVYFKFHMTSKQAILKLLEYRKVIKNQQDKHQEEPDILQLARFVKYFQLEFKAIDLLAKVAGILQGDKETLLFVIKTLYQEALIQQNEKKMIIFKSLTRCLGMFLFVYFDLDLRKLNHQQNKDQIQQLIKYLGVTNQQFALNISKLFKVCLQTYLFHSKILAEPGLNSTLYTYIYFYKIKNRLVSSLDALNIKMLTIMHVWPQVNKEPVISPDDHIWNNTVIALNDTQKHEIQSRVTNLQLMLNELNMVTASESNQLYIAYHINPNCGLYQPYIENVLMKILNQEKGNFTLARVKEDQEWFFHHNVDLAKNYLKKICSYDKVKKAFILNKQNQLQSDNSQDLINYNDFRCNITNKGDFQSPELTLELIKQSKYESIFDSLWSIETIKKFVAKAVEYMKLLSTQEPTQENQTNAPSLDKLKPLFGELMKLIYIKRKVSPNSDELQTVLEFLKATDNCNTIINPFYQKLFYSQKMEEEKPISLQQVELNDSPKKSGLQRIKSTEEQRKKKLKDRMELKKKAIKERYRQQLVKFESQEKIKLEKEEVQEFTEHKLNCIICKNDEQENLVFLVKISFKNHEKLLGLGEGVTCISVTSCYHTVDYACYSKLQSQVGLKKRPLIKCPFCKFAANTFLPVKATSNLVPQALKKFEGSLFIEKNLDEVSILEEIIKSFYHYALLAYLDPQRTLHKRLRIYKILFEILKQNSQLYDIEKVYEKFITKTMNLNPKMLGETYETKRSQQLLQLSLMLQNNDEEISLEELSQSQIDHLLNAMSQQEEMSEEDSNSNPNMIMKIFNKVKQNFSPNKKQKEEEKLKNKFTSIFKQTLSLLFKELQMKPFHIQEEKPQFVEKHTNLKQNINKQPTFEKTETMKEQFSHDVQLCLKRLFDEKLPHNHNSIYEDLNQRNDLLKLRDLPINFKPLGHHNKCSCCHEITSTMALCLLCDWQGCLRNCLASGKGVKSEHTGFNKKGGTFNHSRTHGQQSLFLILEKCNITSITVDGLSSTLGCIYKDEWGNNFEHKQPWENFFLDQGELNRIKIVFLHEQ